MEELMTNYWREELASHASWLVGTCSCVPVWERGDWHGGQEAYLDVDRLETLRVTEEEDGTWYAGRYQWVGHDLMFVEVAGYPNEETAKLAAQTMPMPFTEERYRSPREFVWRAMGMRRP